MAYRPISDYGIIAFSVVLSVLLMAMNGCGIGRGTNEPEELEPVEIREYEGMNLSSIDDFRENSIKGPQYVDTESYQLKITGLVENPTTHTYDEVLNNHKPYKKVVATYEPNCEEPDAIQTIHH